MSSMDSRTKWLFRILVAHIALELAWRGIVAVSSYVYRSVMAQQEPKGRTWRIVKNVVKHADGSVTNKILRSGLPRDRALRQTRVLNGHGPQPQ